MAFETFLDELFNKELCFQIDEDEIIFIRTGIETLVQIIADLAWKDAYKHIEAETEYVLKKYPDLRVSRNGKYRLSDIVKAGSFYELTKNVYPDQFDYIFLMSVLESSEQFVVNETDIVTKVSDLHNCFRDILSTCDISFPSLAERKNYIRFDRYIERKGPASRLRFIYVHGKTERHIYVDLVPAFKVLLNGQVDDVANKCGIRGFKEEVKVSSSIILVQEHISFVETEVHVMKNVLSSKHIKAYKLLKYILNGNYTDNARDSCTCKARLLRVLGHSKPNLVPSYHMKRAAILHHYECQNESCEHVAPCLFQMMESIKIITLITSVRKLYELYMERPFLMTGYRQDILDKTICSFKELETLEKKRENHEVRELENLLGKSPALCQNLHHDEINGIECELNEITHPLQQPLLCDERKASDKHVKTEQKHSQKDDMQNIDSKRLTNIRENNARDSSDLSRDVPLLSNSKETDDKRERTKASDWFKTICTYFSNLTLILMSGLFVILVFYALT